MTCWKASQNHYIAKKDTLRYLHFADGNGTLQWHTAMAHYVGQQLNNKLNQQKKSKLQA